MPASRRKRTIEKLRKMYPGSWKWDHEQYCWVGPEFCVYRVPRNTSQKTHVRFFRSDTKEEVVFSPSLDNQVGTNNRHWDDPLVGHYVFDSRNPEKIGMLIELTKWRAAIRDREGRVRSFDRDFVSRATPYHMHKHYYLGQVQQLMEKNA